jgi:cyclopropane fatty-acyl-phospholipid synthase-like methyltransferase
VSEWFQSFFTGAYLDVQRGSFTPEQSENHATLAERALGLTPGARVLDAPCGAGRLTVPLAKRCYQMTGLDITAVYVEDARAAAATAGVTIDVHHRDMRDLDGLGPFDAAINFWGSFGYFDDAGDAAFAAAVCRALVPGGRFLIEGHVHETLIPRWQPRGWNKAQDTYILEERVFDTTTSRVESDWTFLGPGISEHKHISMRLYSAGELAAMLRKAGFASARVLDATTLEPVTIGARRMITIATR